MSDLTPPDPARQPAFQRPILPACWADLAEDDPEMQLMGPPLIAPNCVDDAWCQPRYTSRQKTQVPIGPFINTRNQFAALMHQLAPEEEQEVRAAWEVSDPAP